MAEVLKGMDKRAHFNFEMHRAVYDLEMHHDQFCACFLDFFAELIDASDEYLAAKPNIL